MSVSSILLIAVPVALAVVFLWLAASLLFKRPWFLAWLRGSLGLVLLSLAFTAGILAWSLSSFTDSRHTALANLELFEIHSHKWRLLVRINNGSQASTTLSGDEWNLEVDTIKLPFSQVFSRVHAIGERYSSRGLERKAQKKPGESHNGKRSYIIQSAGRRARPILELLARLPFVQLEKIQTHWFPMYDNGRYSVWVKNGRVDIRQGKRP